MARKTLLIVLMACLCAVARAQDNDTSHGAAQPTVLFYRTSQGAGATASVRAGRPDRAPVQGAPYSAQMTTEAIQTLADGNRIVEKATGFVARDSLGRTRQQMELPAIGHLSAVNLPQIVFIQDPVAQMAYTLNLSDKTAHRTTGLPSAIAGPGPLGSGDPAGPSVPVVVARGGIGAGGPLPPTKDVMFFVRRPFAGEQGQTSVIDLGSQVIEGVVASGTRTTLTIPAGQIGNDDAINVVTEVWMSPELKVIVSSRWSDPRTGVRTFQLTNLQRGEPDASLFVVPSDFTMIDGRQPIVYAPR
jgi:hypothetical protein